MLTRTCPYCQNKLDSYNHYFCNLCGKLLPKEFFNTDSQAKVKIYNALLESESIGFLNRIIGIFLHKRVLGGFLIIILAAVVLLGLENFAERVIKNNLSMERKIKDTKNAQPESSTTPNILNLHLPFKEVPFDRAYLDEFVPGDVDIYVYGTNLGFLLSNSPFGELYKNVFKNHAEVLDSSFVVFSMIVDNKREWGLVSKISNEGDINTILSSDNSLKSKYKFLDDYILVYSSDDLFDHMKDSKSSVERNILLNPFYVTRARNLPLQGQALIIFFSDDGKRALSKVEDYGFSNQVTVVVDAIIKSGYNELGVL